MTQVSTTTRNGLTPLSSLAVSLFATMVVFSTFSAVAQTTEPAEKVSIKVITMQDGKTVANSANSLEEAQNNPAIREALQKANIDLKNLKNGGKTVSIQTNTTDGNGKNTTLIVNSGDTKAHCVVVNCTSKNGTATVNTETSYVVSGDNAPQAVSDEMIQELKAENDKIMIWNSDDDASFAPADATAPNAEKTVVVRVNADAPATVDAPTAADAPAREEKTVIVRVNRQESAGHSPEVTKNIIVTRSSPAGKGMSGAECVVVCKGKGTATANCSGKGGSVAKTAVAAKETAQMPGSLQLSAYPNPTQGEFTLAFTAKEPANTSITVTDLTGRAVYSEKLENFSGDYTKSLNLSEHPKGNYLVKVSQGSVSAVANIVIE